MLDVLLPPSGGQLVGFGREYAFREVLAAEFADECEAGGCEEHLLPYGGGIGDVCNGNERLVGGGERVGATEEDVEGFVGLDVSAEVGEVVEEGRGCGRDCRAGDDGFFVNTGKETTLRGGDYELAQGGLELLGCCDCRLALSPAFRSSSWWVPEMPDCMMLMCNERQWQL